MNTANFAFAVDDGVYRIRTDQRTPPLYFEWQANNSVKPAALKAEGDEQLWKISQVKENQKGTYTITSIAGDVQLSVLAYTEDGKEKSRVYTGGEQEWHLEARVDQFVIRVADADKCIDLADNDWLIIWDFHNGLNQRFSLEEVVPDVAPGGYSLTNRFTKGVLCVYTGYEQLTAPVRVLTSVAGQAYDTWTITPKRAGFTLQNTYGLTTPRWLADGSTGPVVRLKENVCRITRVLGTDFYTVAMGMEKGAYVLMDTNAPSASNVLVSLAEPVKSETRQHWKLAPKKE